MFKRNKSRSLGREGTFKVSEEELELYKKIRSMIGVVKEREVAIEERKKWAEEFAKEDTSNIFKELGLE